MNIFTLENTDTVQSYLEAMLSELQSDIDNASEISTQISTAETMQHIRHTLVESMRFRDQINDGIFDNNLGTLNEDEKVDPIA